MKLLLASIAQRPHTGPMEALVQQYLLRTRPYLPAEARAFRTEAALFASLGKDRGRTLAVLLDSTATRHSSEALDSLIDLQKQTGAQLLVFAIGPANGWNPDARAKAHHLLSLGPMTLPHELARLVLAEQIYRACTILAGHPYHSGH